MNKEIREYDKNVQFEIGQRIQEMRLDKNMKSIELATELGITRNQRREHRYEQTNRKKKVW